MYDLKNSKINTNPSTPNPKRFQHLFGRGERHLPKKDYAKYIKLTVFVFFILMIIPFARADKCIVTKEHSPKFDEICSIQTTYSGCIVFKTELGSACYWSGKAPKQSIFDKPDSNKKKIKDKGRCLVTSNHKPKFTELCASQQNKGSCFFFKTDLGRACQWKVLK